jgi:hypothetical protein
MGALNEDGALATVETAYESVCWGRMCKKLRYVISRTGIHKLALYTKNPAGAAQALMNAMLLLQSSCCCSSIHKKVTGPIGSMFHNRAA